MTANPASLAYVYEGWEGYRASLAHAMASLTPDQLAWRPAPLLRSVGDIALHISLGRLEWFYRMGAPGSAGLALEAAALVPSESMTTDRDLLLHWLTITGDMIQATLESWTVADLGQTYRQEYQGLTYAVSRQWTIWRIMAHDIHHGGELAVMLGTQGIAIEELGELGGHITMPPLAEP